MGRSIREIIEEEIKDVSEVLEMHYDRYRHAEEQIARKDISALTELGYRNIRDDSCRKANELYIEVKALKRVLGKLPYYKENPMPTSNLKED